MESVGKIMIKIFFATFFLAELIIAFAVIIKIYQFDREVISLNKQVLNYQVLIKPLLADFRVFLTELIESVIEIRAAIIKKKQEYLSRVLETSVMYGGIFLLKGKYKKTVFAYQMMKEIYEGIQESAE